MIGKLFGKNKVEAIALGIDYSIEYTDINNWKLDVETNAIPGFRLFHYPAILDFYLKNWNNDIEERTAKRIEVLPGKVFGFWTLPLYSHRISAEIVGYFKDVFKQTQINKGDDEDYWERQENLDMDILEGYLKEIKPFVFQFDHQHYGYQMVQISSRYEATHLRGANGYDVNWSTEHTFDKANDKREFIRFEQHADKDRKVDWLPIEDRKLYLFDNPKTGVPEGFMIKKTFPEEVQIEQYDRVCELVGLARHHKLPIRLRFNQC